MIFPGGFGNRLEAWMLVNALETESQLERRTI